MLDLLASLLKRLITATTSPFRMLIVRAQHMLNINVISAKLIQPLTKNVKKLMTLRPSDKSDYVRVGRFLVFKQLLALIILAVCAGVFIYFQMFAKKIEAAPVSLTGIKTDVNFRYDDITIKDFTGIANIMSFDGGIVYTGEIDKGVCKGSGLLYARDGRLVYEGGFAGNKYNGYGVKYSPDGKAEYEGEFADNLYHGTGKLYNARGAILYTGGFAAGEYDGNGKLYDESGGLVYEGAFAAGKSHGIGTRYYPGGTIQYRGEFFEGTFQGRGELYDKSGRLLYTGAMRDGKINYRALVGATLADVEAAFSETPAIYYQENGNSCFFYEKAGAIITTDCRVKVYEWEREKGNPSDGYYFMPEESIGGEPEENVYEAPAYDREQNGDDDLEYADDPDPSFTPSLAFLRGNLTPTLMNWVVIDPYNPESSSESSSSGSSSSSSSSGSSSSSNSDSSESSASSEAQTGNSGSPASENSNNGNSVPDFVDKTKQLYFEIDKDVWQPEQELDKSKVFIRRVTVLDSTLPPESGMTPIEDNGPPSVEDCVAVDHIRRQAPTAFADVMYEMDKQNKLFQRVWNINHADRIIRKAFIADDVTYRFCYRPENTETPDYYSIEAR